MAGRLIRQDSLSRSRRGVRAILLATASTVAICLAGATAVEAAAEASVDHSGLASLRPELLALAESAADRYLSEHDVDRPQVLTVIDYSLPSTAPRLWVIDRTDRSVVFHRQVAHGRGSGGNYATRFSNREGSHQSSLGLFLTEETYVGRNGYSLRLRGLEPGINDRARQRTIVLHGAWYATPEFARAHGRLGRSWGCPALDPAIARAVIDRIRGGSLLFVYAPEADWLERSPYLSASAQRPAPAGAHSVAAP